MTDDEFRQDHDREAVERAHRPRFPDPAKVRRVRIDDTHREMAQRVHADHEREREHEGATGHE